MGSKRQTMKKHYLFLAGLLISGFASQGQILNQSAGWPSTDWVLTGSYSSNAGVLEASPLTTPNFAFDDDDALSGNDDNIAAESPVIDLTAAFDGGETSLKVTVEYGYYYLESDVLRFEYWDADGAEWVAWGGNVPGNSTDVTDDFCTIPKTVYQTPALSIANFSATQLTGFRYRISYDDNPEGADWNYGFCFNSPTITSEACASPDSLEVTAIDATSVSISWNATADGFEFVLDSDSDEPEGAGAPLSEASFTSTDPLTPETTYYFHVRATCAGDTFSGWSTIMFTTYASPPANDECSGAIGLSVNDDMDCGQVTSGTLAGSTDSGIESDTGLADDDVWFSFEATSDTHYLSLNNVDGDPTDLVHEVFSGDCGSLTSLYASDSDDSIAENLTAGEIYYVRVFSYYDDFPATTTFDVCVGTMPGAPANDECVDAVSLTVDVAFCTGSNTNGTTAGATSSGVENPDCFNYGLTDVWYSFMVPTGTATVDISMDFEGGTLNDSEMVLYSGTCGTFTEIDCDQDGGEVGNGWLSIITDAPVEAGETYYLRISGYSEDDFGSFCVQVMSNELGVQDHGISSLTAYPNPVSDLLNLDMDSEISKVEVFNMLGQKIDKISFSAGNTSLDMSGLSSGAYFVKVTSGDASKTIKVVKQ